MEKATMMLIVECSIDLAMTALVIIGLACAFSIVYKWLKDNAGW